MYVSIFFAIRRYPPFPLSSVRRRGREATHRARAPLSKPFPPG
jgi:hypothetical protein